MIFKIGFTAAILVYGMLALGSPNAQKYNELYAKYEECDKNNDYSGSVKYLEEALPFIHPDSIECFSNTYNGLSYACWDLGQYEKAIDYGNLALECDFHIGDSAPISTSFNLLAILFTHQRRFDEAEHYIQQAITYVPHNNTQMKAGRYAVFGEILSANGKDAEAISYISKAYTLDSIDNRTDKMPVRLSQLGTAYMRNKEYAKAETTLALATDGLRAIGNTYSLCINLISQTEIYIILGRKADAEKAAAECLTLSTQLNKRKTKLEAMRYLAKLRKSPELYEQTLALNDSLYNEQISQQIADFEVRYATAEKEKENAQLQVIINRQHYALVVFIIAFFALIIGTFLVYIVRRMRRDIEHTEKMARELFVNPNRPKQTAVSYSESSVKNENITNQPKVVNLNNPAEQIVRQKVDNEEHAVLKEEVKSDVSIQLSPRELDIVKACCQGKLSKEIADDFGISKKTVDNHKSTIYQKIGVCNNTELILFAVKHGLARV